MNKSAAPIIFNFVYDGTSTSVSIDIRKGPVVYQTYNPMFYHTTANDVINIAFGSSNGLSAIGSLSGDMLTITVPQQYLLPDNS